MNIDGSGNIKIDSGIGFFDHMLRAMAFYAGFDLDVVCQGDLYVDTHNTVEDIGLSLGAAFKEALGDKKVYRDLLPLLLYQRRWSRCRGRIIRCSI